MLDDYLIVPQFGHCGCMVDLLTRAALLDQAINFVKNMPLKADAVIWAALLVACWIYKNIELSEHALEPKNPANYVML